MSLLKQLSLAILVFLVLAFTGTFSASLESSREQLADELHAHAQDSATALSLSLGPHIEDPAMLELMVSSIFDSGYFASIRVLDIQGNALLERSAAIASNVPNWFEKILNLRHDAGRADILQDKTVAARIEILSHPQYALARLWDSTVSSLLWLLACGVCAVVAGGWLLRRQLRPLEEMRLQAEAITHREFRPLPDMARAPEFSRVVTAMNQMVEKLHGLLAEEAERSEKLRNAAYQDSLTGLANRQLLMTHLQTRLAVNEANSAGYLLVLRINDLAGLNQRLGALCSDSLLRSTADRLTALSTELGNEEWLAARNRGGEFTLVAPGLAPTEARRLAQRLSEYLEKLRANGFSDCTPVAHVGMTAFQPGESIDSVLKRADLALTQARQDSKRPWVCNDSNNANAGDSLHDWQQRLERALQPERIQLYFQPVARCENLQNLHHHKVMTRLLDDEGAPLPAARFLPWINRLGWHARLDVGMLHKTLDLLKADPRPLAVSVSPEVFTDPQSRQQVLHLLQTHPEQAPLLTLELDERSLPASEYLQSIGDDIHQMGAQWALQHCGGQFSKIGNLANLGLAYMKLDGSYIRHIDQQADKRLFVEAVRRTTHSIDLPLIAEMVEQEGELAVLRELGFDAAMGHLIGAPTANR